MLSDKRRWIVAGAALLGGVLTASSAAWGCQVFRGRALWEGNGVAGSSTDGTNGNLHYPPTAGASWDLITNGGGGAMYHHCNATPGDELPGAGLDGETGNASWYGGGVAPVVRMVAGASGADLAVKFEPSPECLDANGSNKMASLTGSDGYEVYTAAQEGPGFDSNESIFPHACALGFGNMISPLNAIQVDADGYSIDGSGNRVPYVVNNFRAGGIAGTYRMICVRDSANGSSHDGSAAAINVKVI